MGGNLAFRNGLVILQFVLSIVLLTGTIVICKQLKFVQHRSPGFTPANLVHTPMTGELWSKQGALRAELARNPLTSNYTIVNDLPINLVSGNVDGKWQGKDPNAQIVIPLAALAALVVAWLTVSNESLKAAMGNPVKILKSE